MPPTLTASLNPIDHPAFSPLDTAKPLATQLSSHFMKASTTTIATASNDVPRIPYKFFAAQQATQVQTLTRSLTRGGNVVTVAQATHPTAVTSQRTPPKTPAPALDLPDLPSWALGILVGGLTFLLVVSVVLFIAQFPPQLGWLRDIKRRWQAGYVKIGQDEHEMRDGSARSSAVAPSHCQHRDIKRRRPKLSIDTGVGVAYDGLDILAPKADNNCDEEHVLLQTRHSYDEEVAGMESKSPALAKWQALTAPLPAIPTFSGGGRAGDDSEARLYVRSASDITTPDLFDFKSYFQQDEDNEYPGSALLKKVNGSIYQAADKLSKAFYDQVNQPEEGLLLPVHNEEREKQVTPFTLR